MMLEVSLRKLVREEAANAAVATIQAMSAGLAEAIRVGTRDAVANATSTIDRYQRLTWSPGSLPEQMVAATPIDVESEISLKLADMRADCLKIAVSAYPHGVEPEVLVATAALFAAFVLDGTPSLRCSAPQTPAVAEQVA